MKRKAQIGMLYFKNTILRFRLSLSAIKGSSQPYFKNTILRFRHLHNFLILLFASYFKNTILRFRLDTSRSRQKQYAYFKNTILRFRQGISN